MDIFKPFRRNGEWFNNNECHRPALKDRINLFWQLDLIYSLHMRINKKKKKNSNTENDARGSLRSWNDFNKLTKHHSLVAVWTFQLLDKFN